MSRYFARLAQRSGLLAPTAPPAPAHPLADIVEQDTQVDAAPASHPPGAPGAPAARAAPPLAASSNVSPTQAPSVAPERVAPDSRAASARKDNRISNVPSIEAPIPLAVVREQTPSAMTLPASPTPSPPSAPQPVASARPLAVAPATRAPLSPIDPLEALAETFAESPSSTVARREPALETLQLLWSRARIRPLVDGPMPRLPEMLEIADAPVPVSAPATTRLQAESSARHVEVRIGAVRLEIHAPPPARVAPAPAPTVLNEPPRFVPRRHYLRG